MKVLFSLLNIIFIFFNLYVLVFFYGLHEYKITWKLNDIYSYMLLDWKIKTMYNSIEWQNIVIEKGSNLIIKEKIYMITQDTVIGWVFAIEKDWRIVKQEFKNKTLLEIYTSQKKLVNVIINSFWNDIMNNEISLSANQIKSSIQGNNIVDTMIEIN